MNIYIGADHRGFELKTELFALLVKKPELVVLDKGNKVFDENDDFPIFAGEVARAVIADPGSFGVLLCGGGQGVAMAANRFAGIRAVVVDSIFDVKNARRDNDANIICLSADKFKNNSEEALRLIEVFVASEYENAERFVRRNALLDEL